MSVKWDEFKNDAGKVASKVAVKTGELADAASARVRQQTLKLRLCEEYEKLGRITYRNVKSGRCDNTDASIAEIDRIKADMEKIKADIAAKKQARAEEKARAAEEKRQKENTAE